MFDFRQITLFCLEKRFSKHKMTICFKTLGGHGSFDLPWMSLCASIAFKYLLRPGTETILLALKDACSLRN